MCIRYRSGDIVRWLDIFGRSGHASCKTCTDLGDRLRRSGQRQRAVDSGKLPQGRVLALDIESKWRARSGGGMVHVIKRVFGRHIWDSVWSETAVPREPLQKLGRHPSYADKAGIEADLSFG